MEAVFVDIFRCVSGLLCWSFSLFCIDFSCCSGYDFIFVCVDLCYVLCGISFDFR